MPNWCTNTLTITGNVSTLCELKTVIEADRAGLLEAIAPIGEWEYANAVEKWGTKWDVSTEGLEYTLNGDGTATIEGYFDSAWSPPIEAFHQLAQDWDSCYIQLKYFEPGMGFVGVWDSEGEDTVFENIDELLEDDEQDPQFKFLAEEFAISIWYDSGEAVYEEDLELRE